MRIIAGKARGHRFDCLKGQAIRPTQDRVREAIFSTLTFEVPESGVLDLFAGTGAMGLEALSRGAKTAVFLDKDPKACALVLANSRACQLVLGAKILQQDALSYIRSYPATEPGFDIIFADPPYYENFYETIFREINHSKILKPTGRLVVESPRGLALPSNHGNLVLNKLRIYGDTAIRYYEYQN